MDNNVDVAHVGANQTAALHIARWLVVTPPPARSNGMSDGRGAYRGQTTGNYQIRVRSPQHIRGGGDGAAAADNNRGNGDVSAVVLMDPQWYDLGGGFSPPLGLDNGVPDQHGGWRHSCTEASRFGNGTKAGALSYTRPDPNT